LIQGTLAGISEHGVDETKEIDKKIAKEENDKKFAKDSIRLHAFAFIILIYLLD
jgi:hypothetical protein